MPRAEPAEGDVDDWIHSARDRFLVDMRPPAGLRFNASSGYVMRHTQMLFYLCVGDLCWLGTWAMWPIATAFGTMPRSALFFFFFFFFFAKAVGSFL